MMDMMGALGGKHSMQPQNALLDKPTFDFSQFQEPLSALGPQFAHKAMNALQGGYNIGPQMMARIPQQYQGLANQYMTYRNDLKAWQGQNGHHGHGREMGGPASGPIIAPGQLPQQTNPGMRLGPADMVGQSYAVQGMHPGVGQYGLPTY
jgi:hypothetical protein